jgi:hypothetical protein
MGSASMGSARADSDPRLAASLPVCLSGLRIAVGEVPESLEKPMASGVLWQAAPGQLLLEIPDRARVLVSHDEIVVMPLAPDALTGIGPLLRGTPFAAVMYLRGHFACNAAAVAGPDGAVLIIGRTASGKSTLAAALMQRGLRLLADDAASIMLAPTGTAKIAPVWPELVNWSDAKTRLFKNGMPPWLERCPSPVADDPYWADYPYWKVRSDRFCPTETPLKAAYHLRRDRLVGGVQSIPMTGMGMLARRMIVPYQAAIADALVDPGGLLAVYQGVSACCPIVDVGVPIRDSGSFDELADAIMRDCGWPVST